MKPKPVCILMATYNGAPWLADQIASLQRQTHHGWTLIIGDDGSSDDTLKVASHFSRDDPRISVLESSSGEVQRGAVGNFNRLLLAAMETTSDIFFLCDQDDQWLPQKLELQSNQFPESGAENFSLLVHSDLSVVDESLNELQSSLIKHMALEPLPDDPQAYLLTRNFVTGCATACNRRLLERALPVPKQAIMHDWWLALVASATGEIRYLPQSLVRYRQHAENAIGAKGFWHGLNPTNNWMQGWQAGNKEYLATYRQIRALAEHASGQGHWPADSLDTLEKFTELETLPVWRRILQARFLGLRQGNALLQLIFYLRLITAHGKNRRDPERSHGSL